MPRNISELKTQKSGGGTIPMLSPPIDAREGSIVTH